MNEPKVWVLADERPGTASQALGVAEALGWPYQQKSLHYTLAAKLPNALLGRSLIGIDKSSRGQLAEPWPDVVIGAGRRSASVARWVKQRTGGRAYLCHIMWPGTAGLSDFDLVAVPTHDELNGVRPNVMRVTGAPHRVTEARLAIEGAKWRPRLAKVRHPMVALMVGGATKNRPFTSSMARELAEKASALTGAMGGSLVVSTSRRTGRGAEEALLSGLPDAKHVYRWGDEGENPYFGFLALADAVVVTGDSVSMVSEACATSAPVYIFAPSGMAAPKHERLHRHLYASGFAEPLDGSYRPWSHPRLNAASDIAKVVRQAMAERVS